MKESEIAENIAKVLNGLEYIANSDIWLIIGDKGIRKQINETIAYKMINEQVKNFYIDGYDYRELDNIIAFLKIMLIK